MLIATKLLWNICVERKADKDMVHDLT